MDPPLRACIDIEADPRLDLVEALEVAAEAGLTIAQLGLGFTDAHPAISSTIIGPRTMEQLEGNWPRPTWCSTPGSSTPSMPSALPGSTLRASSTTCPTPRWRTRRSGVAERSAQAESAAASSAAMSSLVMASMAETAACARFGSGSPSRLQGRGHDLPGDTEAVLQPAALAGLAAVDERVPEPVDLGLVGAGHHEGDGLVELEGRPSVEEDGA